MRRDFLLACCATLSACALLAAPAARAETTAQAPAQKSGDASGKNSTDVPLSKKLDESKGVIKPSTGVDPGIHQDPPAKTGDKMPVIIPPGEPGGDQSIQPK